MGVWGYQGNPPLVTVHHEAGPGFSFWGVNRAMIPSSTPGRFTWSTSDAIGPERRAIPEFSWSLIADVSALCVSLTTAHSQRRQAQALLMFPLPVNNASHFWALHGFRASLLCQCSQNLSLWFGQINFYRLYSQTYAGNLFFISKERPAHYELENIPFLINALFPPSLLQINWHTINLRHIEWWV